jgi:hypothetical protein
MADEIVDGASSAEVTPAPDLRSTIAAAVEKQRNPDPVETETVDPVEPAEKVVRADTGKTETEAERNERLRDKSGKFATEKNAVKAAAKEAPAEQAETVKSGEAGGEEKPALRPPPGWSPSAKVAFEKLPPEVQQAVAQREVEVNKGFEKLTRFKPIERFDEMARQSGTTLDKALENYVGMENKLRQDFAGGITELCQRQGVNPIALANHILARNGVQSAQQDRTGETPAHQPAPGVDLSPVMQKISALENFIQEQQSQGVQTEIQRFASNPKNTFFENVKVQMGQLIAAGQADDLDDAYDKACWANKEIRELLIKQQMPAPSANAADAVSRAKAAAKATGGAPSAGFKPNAGTAGADIRSTIVAAVNAQRGL